MLISKSIHVVANGIIPFFFMAEYYLIVCMYHISFICLSVDGCLGCCHVLVIVNSTVINFGIHVPF